MQQYDLFGAINTIFIFISLIGVYSQLKTVQKRKANGEDSTTKLLSLNQFSVSYVAYLSFFIYGYSISPFNHYIVWPRLLASILVAFILFEIWRDRKTNVTLWCFSCAIGLLLLSLIGLFIGQQYLDQGKVISTTLILLITALLAQGYYHQIMLIWRSGETGAVDLKMSQFILMMDVSTIAFALSMGLSDGWPLLCLATVSGLTKLCIMYLFRWVRTSDKARLRRQLA